ncbi:hypothetical protein ABID47_006137 [Paenibacillus favisporus]|uniref:Uncharacterized protein n=1 Tax=Paenibacillus favisporus TaxID=221028 RepID=A0ABV2FCT7_9BACL
MSFNNYGELCTQVYDLTKTIGQSLDGDIEYYSNKLRHCNGRIHRGYGGFWASHDSSS